MIFLGGRVGGRGGGGQGRCEEVKLCENLKKNGGSGWVWGVRVDVNEEVKLVWKLKKKCFFFFCFFFFGGGGGVGGQGGCERRSEAFVKIQKIYWGGAGSGGGEGLRVGGHGGCERRSEVFVKIQK